MSRRIDVIHQALTAGIATDVFGGVPAGHKYEVITVSVGTDSSVAVHFYLAYNSLDGVFFADDILLAAGFFGTAKSYNALTCVEGEGFYVIPVPASGSPAVNCVVNYVDVDYNS